MLFDCGNQTLWDSPHNAVYGSLRALNHENEYELAGQLVESKFYTDLYMSFLKLRLKRGLLIFY